MAKDTRRLGRGLSSLIRTTTADDTPKQADHPGAEAEAQRATPSAAPAPVGVNPLPREASLPAEPASQTQTPSTASNNTNPPTPGPLPSQSNLEDAPNLTPEPKHGESVLSISNIVANKRQPRQQFNVESIAALAGSIARSGLVQPIVVRTLNPGTDVPATERRYEIIAGERRWRASKAAGLNQIPAIIREVDDQQALELALIENIQREDLNAIDRAEAYAAYCREFGLKADEVAQRLSEDRTTVVNYIRLLELPADAKDLVASGQLSMGHGRALLGLPSDQARSELAQAAVNSQLSVRALEDIVRRRKTQTDEKGDDSKSPLPAARAKPANVLDLENRLQQAVGTKVRIKEGRRKGHGRLVIDYYSFDDFERIAGLLGLRDE